MFENPTNNDKKLVSALTLYKVNSYNQITITNSTIISIKKIEAPCDGEIHGCYFVDGQNRNSSLFRLRKLSLFGGLYGNTLPQLSESNSRRCKLLHKMRTGN
jgi:hypothetical protein